MLRLVMGHRVISGTLKLEILECGHEGRAVLEGHVSPLRRHCSKCERANSNAPVPQVLADVYAPSL